MIYQIKQVEGYAAKVRWLSLMLLFMGMTFALLQNFAVSAPLAGTVIRNQAVATYRHDGQGVNETIRSNTTEITVAPVESITLTPDLRFNTQPGAMNTFAHVLTNTGNINTRVTLTTAAQGGDQFDMTDMVIVLDENENGVFDSGELTIANGGALELRPGQSVALLLTGRTPVTVVSGDTAIHRLNASTPAGAQSFVTDTVVVRGGANLVLIKDVSPNQPASAGDVVRYGITLANQGFDTARGINVTVDGTTRSAIPVRDVVPPNLRFVRFTQTAGGTAVYHLVGQPLHQYQTAEPADLSLVDAIAYLFPEIRPGMRLAVSFEARISPIVGGSVRNVADVYYADAETGTSTTSSNPVVFSLPPAPAQLDFYRNATLDQVTPITRAGLPLHLESTIAACNTNPSLAEEYPISLRSQLSGDFENFTIRETGPNTGIFILTEVPTMSWPTNPQVSGNSTMELGANDTVSAELTCAGQTLRTRILVDPAGIVFNSRTNAPVAGATVTLISVATGLPATVLDFNGLPAPATVVTGADGFFQFPLVAPGEYFLQVVPPVGLSFPSEVPRASLPPGRIIIDGSFGGRFTVSPITGPVVLDVPLDPPLGAGFVLEKRADAGVVRIGEPLVYTLRIANTTALGLNLVQVEDALPPGFLYLKGSTRVDGVAVADPVGAPGPKLTFSIGNMPINAVRRITYAVRAGAGVREGTAVNTAIASAVEGRSNTARAFVKVDRDVFRDDETYILGKVFIDCNYNRVQDPEELGIPGVRVILDDGTFAISDAEGKYSFYGISPRTHTLKVEGHSLPVGAEMKTTNNRNAGDAHSLFIDLKKGELHRADFAEGSCSDDIVNQVKKRRARGEIFASEISSPLDSHINTETLTIDPKTRPASGVIGRDGRISGYTPLLMDAPAAKQSLIEEGPIARNVQSVSLETLLPTVTDDALAFMDLKDGDTMPSRDVSIRVKGKQGIVFALSVNGEEISQSRVGQKAVMASKGIEAWEFVAVKLRSGENTLKLVARDPFGNERGTVSIKLRAPGDMGRIEIDLPKSSVAADGQTPVPVRVRIVDEAGVPVTSRTPVTLETNLGRWLSEDLNPNEPGLQVFVTAGAATVQLVPPDRPSDARIRASSGDIKREVLLPFVPYLSPLVATGLIEGRIALSDFKGDGLVPVNADDDFERQIENLNSDDSTKAGIRGSMYLKGKVKGDYLLTLAYDSEKDKKDRLFRDIEPERFYPVYGDSAIKGFDAQSTSPLYVRLDKGRSYLLYGDFTTGGGYFTDGGSAAASGSGTAAVSGRKLSSYSRSMTGLRAHTEGALGSVNAFASHDRLRQIVRTVRGEGISGPYPLDATGLVQDSEKIEIITVDRNQPSVIINSRPLTRFTDYTVNELQGSLLFRTPVASLDENLNPVYIRATFEVDNGGEKSWVYGAEGQVKIGKNLEVGAAVARDDAPENRYDLYGVNANLRTGADSFVTAEVAQSTRETGGSGQAQRLEWVQHGANLDAKIYAGQSDTDFSNPNSSLAAGRREAGAKALVRVTDSVKLGGEALYTEDRQTQLSPRQGVHGYAQWQVNPTIGLEGGLRHVNGDTLNVANGLPAGLPSETNSARARVTLTPSIWSKARLFGEYEQDVSNSELQHVSVGGDYQLGSKGRVYARHDLESSLSSSNFLTENGGRQNNTVIGLDYDYMSSGSVFSEYRVRDAISAREAEAALGLRNTWTFDQMKLSTQFERVQPMTETGRENTAVALGAEYLISPLIKTGARLEWRISDAERSVLNTLAYAQKINLNWTGLAKNTLSKTVRRSDGKSLLRNRSRVGLAYRTTDTNRMDGLMRYELRLDDDETLDIFRRSHIFSTHLNWHPSRPVTLTGRYAAKHSTTQGPGFEESSVTHLLSGRVNYDITERLDSGLLASTLIENSGGGQSYGLGAEMGYHLLTNLWLSGGYNFMGYDDDELADTDYTVQGPYARLRFKFDEDVMTWLE